MGGKLVEWKIARRRAPSSYVWPGMERNKRGMEEGETHQKCPNI